MHEVTFLPTGDRVGAVGYGAMGLSWMLDRRGVTEQVKRDVLRAAVDDGMNFVDTATLYGGGANEELVGAALHDRYDRVFLCSKVGLRAEQLDPPKTERCGDPAYIRRAIDDSLRRLQADVIDLYYVHRIDPAVSLEETWGAMSELVEAGKVRSIGLSEVTVEHLNRAQAIHPVAAVQSEYSLWTRDPDGSGQTSDGDLCGDVIGWCRDHGAVFVPFSPVGRGYLTGGLTGREFPVGDFRAKNPRFTDQARSANDDAVLPPIRRVADKHGVPMSAVAIAWTMLPNQTGAVSIPIPGTGNPEHLAENARAVELRFDSEDLALLKDIPAATGTRY